MSTSLLDLLVQPRVGNHVNYEAPSQELPFLQRSFLQLFLKLIFHEIYDEDDKVSDLSWSDLKLQFFDRLRSSNVPRSLF